MTLDQWTAFFGWNALINIVFLLIATLAIVGFRDWVSGIHGRMMGLEKGELSKLYFAYLGAYKIFTLIFGLVPYLVLRFAMGG